MLSLTTGTSGAREADTWTDRLSTSRSGFGMIVISAELMVPAFARPPTEGVRGVEPDPVSRTRLVG